MESEWRTIEIMATGTISDLVKENERIPDIELVLCTRKRQVDEVDGRGVTGLICAASMGKLPMVKYFLKAGAAIDHRDREGNTALMKGCMFGHVDIVFVLVEEGANMQLRNHRGESAKDHAKYNILRVWSEIEQLAGMVLGSLGSNKTLRLVVICYDVDDRLLSFFDIL